MNNVRFIYKTKQFVAEKTTEATRMLKSGLVLWIYLATLEIHI